MKKYTFTKLQAGNYFAQINRAWVALRRDCHVQFVKDYKLIHGRVESIWFGKNRRLVVKDDLGNTHYFRSLDGIMVFAYEAGGYVPATEFGNMRVAH